MAEKIITLQNPPATEKHKMDFMNNGKIYSDRTYNMQILREMGFKGLFGNIRKYANHDIIETTKDVYGRVAITGERLSIFLKKKADGTLKMKTPKKPKEKQNI